MRKWLEPLVEEYLKAVRPLQHQPSDEAIACQWAEWLKGKWAAHGISELERQRSLMTEVRNHLKQALGSDHIALETMNFTLQQWTTMNHSIAARAAAQNEAQVILSPETVNAIVTRATTLLQSRQWSDIAAALAVLTGRRSTEVLKTAQFLPSTPYSVIFTGALKRKGEAVPLTFEIPTLCQADYILKATRQLRRILPTADKTIEQINQYSNAVASACDKHFGDLVQPIAGRDNLYTHLFRKIYATIATYFYCPPGVDEAEFRAEIQGHFAGHPGMSMAARRTIASDRHYRSYLIADEQGNIRKGIHLNWRDVQVIAAFRADITNLPNLPESPISEPIAMPQSASKSNASKSNASKSKSSTPSSKRSSQPDLNSIKQNLAELPPRSSRPSLKVADLERMQTIMAELGIEGTAETLFTALLDRFEQLTEAQSLTELEQTKEANAKVKAQESEPTANMQTIRWFTTEIDTLRAQIQGLEAEKQQVQSSQVGIDQDAIAQLQQENEALKEQLQQTQSRLEAIGQFLSVGGASSPQSPVAAGSSSVLGATSSDHTSDRMKQQQGQVTGLDADVLRALELLMSYNDAEGRSHSERWAISVPTMKDLLKQIGKATQPKIEAVLKARAEAIAEHHQRHGLGERHNRVHKGQSLLDFVKL